MYLSIIGNRRVLEFTDAELWKLFGWLGNENCMIPSPQFQGSGTSRPGFQKFKHVEFTAIGFIQVSEKLGVVFIEDHQSHTVQPTPFGY